MGRDISDAYLISVLLFDITTFHILGDVPKHSEFNIHFAIRNCDQAILLKVS